MLISTKIHPPQLKSNLLKRKHLIDRLSDGKTCRLLLITAPAGYGKTSLVGQWIDRDNIRVAWYSIDDTDNEFDTFFRYLMAALIEVDNGFEKFLGPYLKGRVRLSEDDVVPAVVQALNTLSKDLYVIMDDYHMINTDSVHKAFARLMKYLPPNVHVVIISRYKLPQSLSRLRCEYDMVEITPDDLKFSEDEARHFFKKVIPLELTKNQIRELARIADGWVAGFQIFGLSQAGKEIPEDPENIVKAAGREVVDYLINEVVMAQPEKVRQFLYKTCALSRLNTEICQKITGYSDAGKILDDLQRMNLFLLPLDTQQNWYRYHHLFSASIRQWVEISSPDSLKKTLQKAATWCAENQYLEEAFQYGFLSGDWEFMADLLEDYLGFLFNRWEIVSANSWLSRLPRDVFLRRPLLRLIDCEFKIYKMRLVEVAGILPEIQDLVNEVKEQYEEPQKKLFRDLLSFQKSLLAFYRDGINVDIQKINKAIGEISPEHKAVSGYMRTMIVALTYVYRGELIQAEKHMKLAATEIFPYDSIPQSMDWVILMAAIDRHQGRLKRSEKRLLDALDLLKQKKLFNTPLKYMLYIPISVILYHRNELDSALEYGVQSLKYMERTEIVAPVLVLYGILSNICMAKKDFKQAIHYAQMSKSISEGLDYSSMEDTTNLLFFFISISLGKSDVVYHQVSLGNPDMAEPFSFQFVSKSIVHAISLVYVGQLSEASRLLEALRRRCIKRNIMETVLQIDVFLSGVYFLMGKKESALTMMEKAILFSEKEGYIRPFINYDVLILPLLKVLEEKSAALRESAHFKSLLNACDSGKDGSSEVFRSQTTRNAFDLTKRELEILRFMSNGYRNKQIADKAFISLSTVKTHINSIFRKLDVQSRLQAILKAKDVLQPPV